MTSEKLAEQWKVDEKPTKVTLKRKIKLEKLKQDMKKKTGRYF